MILLHLPGPDSVGGHEDVIMYGPPYTTTSMSVLVVGLKTDQNLASVWTSSMTTTSRNVREVNFHKFIYNFKPNGKSYTNGKL